MSRNGSGTYTLPAGNPVVTGTTIESNWANTTLSDIATTLTDSLSRSGQGGMTAALRIADGTQGAPGVGFANETGSGFYRAGTGEVWAVVQGAQTLNLDANGVYVPADKTTTVDGAFVFNEAGADKDARFEGDTDTNLLFTDASTDRVGIGTNTPAAKLDVNGTAAISGNVTLSGGTANGVLYLDGSKVATSGSNITFNGSNIQRITASSAALQLFKNSTPTVAARFAINTDYADAAEMSVYNGTSWAHNFVIDSTGYAAWRLGGSEQMRLTSTGLGIGTSSPQGKLHVNGTLLVGPQTAARSTSILGAGQQQIEVAGYSALQMFGNSASVDGSYIGLFKSRSGSVGGVTIVQNGDITGGIYFGGADGSAMRVNAGIEAVVDGIPAANDMPGRLVFKTTNAGSSGATEKMRLDSSGNLGLGVTPSAWYSTWKAFEFNAGAISSNGSTLFQLFQNSYVNAAGNYIYKATAAATRYDQSSGIHAWYNAASGTAGNTISFTQAMTLDASGNLGVGTSSPTSGFRLDVQAADAKQRIESTTGTNSVQQRFVNTGGTFYAGIDNSSGSAFGAAYGAVLWHSGNYPMLFGTNNTERARITSGGDLLVGTTNVSLQAGGVRLKNGGGNLGEIALANNSGVSDYVARFLWGTTPTLVGNITVSSTATAYNTSSDRRLKENIFPAEDAGAVIDAIEVVEHDWKAGGHTRYGVIAQDLNAVAPEAVSAGDDGDEIERTWSVDYSKLVPMLIKEIQSLRARVAALEAV